MSDSDDLKQFLEQALGHAPGDLTLYERALTHSSAARDSYERLEFLGDRVLGLTIAAALYDRHQAEPEGHLSQRYNALVARETCAEIGRELGIGGLIRLGKQARDDGANRSDNVVGDVVEALIGALFIDAGFEPARRFVQTAWESRLDAQRHAPKHPKSALQELAAARDLRAPGYEVVSRSGSHHAPQFEVKVSVRSLGEAVGTGTSKQEAETAAAAALLEKLK